MRLSTEFVYYAPHLRRLLLSTFTENAAVRLFRTELFPEQLPQKLHHFVDVYGLPGGQRPPLEGRESVPPPFPVSEKKKEQIQA